MALNHCVDLVMDYRGLKQRWLAQRIGVTDTFVSAMLKGAERWPEHIKERVAHELGVPRDVLFFEGECVSRIQQMCASPETTSEAQP